MGENKTMTASGRQPHHTAALGDDPLAEVHRRLVAIHYALAAATDEDRDVRGWSVHKLMELIRDVNAARKVGT